MWTIDDTSYIVRLAGAIFDLTTLNMKISLLEKSKYVKPDSKSFIDLCFSNSDDF